MPGSTDMGEREQFLKALSFSLNILQMFSP